MLNCLHLIGNIDFVYEMSRKIVMSSRIKTETRRVRLYKVAKGPNAKFIFPLTYCCYVL